jgi:pilus assembly protein CpaB
MTNWKASLPIMLALIIAVTGSFFLYQWLQAQTAPKEVVQVNEQTEAVPVCVATADLTWGTQIKPEMIKTVAFLKDSLPSGYFSKPEDLIDRVVLSPLKANDPIIEHRLASSDIRTGGVSAVVNHGKRAIAVKGDKVIGIAGFILPMNRVDILATLRDPRTKTDVTKVVLEDVLVLATGTQIEKNEKGEPAPVDVYTLEVSPEEGEKLALAAAEGKLQFALRNSTDSAKITTRGATIPETLASLRKPEMKKEGKRWVPKRHTTVEVIKGNSVSKKKLKI